MADEPKRVCCPTCRGAGTVPLEPPVLRGARGVAVGPMRYDGELRPPPPNTARGPRVGIDRG